MNLVSFSLIITGVVLNAAAQLLLKAGTNAVGHFEFQSQNIIPVGMQLAFQPFILGGMACYAISLVVWIMALSRVPVSIAYPMLAIGYLINALVAWQWLGEALSAQKLLGISFIIIGVVLITKS
ncbi:MAG: EamA family transporter [Rhodocyclaceae bacterium]|nr:EamA family transporter [Rhodocyclaceae bacterium]MBK9624470.1 EamA family transporter [Rhodocyclaceae bacterium]MBL0076927.1 EamA family transporter [Rhodocyclaceae bacterium]MBP6110478.1 EamA family transporter [Rhodocyclaceae bacterium]MBP6279749.1 EamA family transporter [Rhodocyclaceae bacterium]